MRLNKNFQEQVSTALGIGVTLGILNQLDNSLVQMNYYRVWLMLVRFIYTLNVRAFVLKLFIAHTHNVRIRYDFECKFLSVV